MINDESISASSSTGALRRRGGAKNATFAVGNYLGKRKLGPLSIARADGKSSKRMTALPSLKAAPTFVLPPKAATPEAPSAAPREMDSILTIYMREAGEVALLTPAEEIQLAARIQRGDNAAREHMIRANLRFVIKIAREYEHLGMSLLDLINEGNIGLMKAVDRFDPAKGGKLTTYASLWIKQQIRRALASQGKTIRLPVHVADKIYHISQAEVRLRSQLGREATDDELAQELNIKVTRLALLRRAAARPSSLDAPLGDDTTSTVAEVIADEAALTPFEQLRDGTETKIVRELVNQLSEREARIIRFRFGLDNGEERTLEDVGKKLKLTRERIRQLQNMALEKLRKMLEDPKLFPLAA
jgi:RNA polymerase primary sigma factor